VTIAKDGSVTAAHYSDGKLDSVGTAQAVTYMSPLSLIDADIRMRAGTPILRGLPVNATDPEDHPAPRI
jgi:hypothetical protein